MSDSIEQGLKSGNHIREEAEGVTLLVVGTWQHH